MPRLVLAVDGGNSKTDVALVGADGSLLSWVRGPGSALGPRRSAALIARLAAAAGGADLGAAHAACFLAGADLPWQGEALQAAIAGEAGPASAEVGNDAWPLLRLGAPAGTPAVGIVCGAGLKCVAQAGADRFEFPGLGWQSGDLSGGGDHLARETVRVAARAEDGRGPDTPLRQAICDRLSVPTVRAVAERLLTGALSERELGVLVPIVLDHADAGDPVAASVVGGLASEIAASALAARRHLAPAAPSDGRWTLVLGGGLFADPAGRLLAALRSTAPELADEFRFSVVDAPPVAGAALLGLDHVTRDHADASRPPTFDDAVVRAFRGSTPRLIDSPEPTG